MGNEIRSDAAEPLGPGQQRVLLTKPARQLTFRVVVKFSLLE